MSEPRRTTSAVTAHIGFTSVCIKKLPSEIGAIRIFDKNQAIGAHGYSAATNHSGKLGVMIRSHLASAVINQNEIIAAPAHFIKFDVVHMCFQPADLPAGYPVSPFPSVVNQPIGGFVSMSGRQVIKVADRITGE